jgi:hypothetical protein
VFVEHTSSVVPIVYLTAVDPVRIRCSLPAAAHRADDSTACNQTYGGSTCLRFQRRAPIHLRILRTKLAPSVGHVIQSLDGFIGTGTAVSWGATHAVKTSVGWTVYSIWGRTVSTVRKTCMKHHRPFTKLPVHKNCLFRPQRKVSLVSSLILKRGAHVSRLCISASCEVTKQFLNLTILAGRDS